MKWDFSIVGKFALKHVEEKSVKNERENFYTLRDMLKVIIVLKWEAQTKLEISMTTLIPEEDLPRQISSNSILFWAGIPLTGTLKCKFRKAWWLFLDNPVLILPLNSLVKEPQVVARDKEKNYCKERFSWIM